MPFAIKDILMRWFMPCRDKKGTLLILNEKYKKSFKGITEKEILTVIHAVMEYISNLYSCANLPISWGKQLLPNWRMQQTRQMMNTTPILHPHSSSPGEMTQELIALFLNMSSVRSVIIRHLAPSPAPLTFRLALLPGWSHWDDVPMPQMFLRIKLDTCIHHMKHCFFLPVWY